jgi:hypothetical protein
MDEEITLESGHRIVIWHDSDSDSPRNWENLGTFQVYHRRYRSPDPIVREPPHINKNEIGLKVWGYDHGGIVYATGDTNPFHCPWDSGFAGIIFCSRAKARVWLGTGRLTKKHEDKVREILEQEVQIYNQWANGEVYGFTVFDPEGEELDSCGGFYGSDRDYMIQEAKSCLKSAIS